MFYEFNKASYKKHHLKEKAEYVNISDFLLKEIGYDYSYLSNSFSLVEGTTIEKYVINQKIEKAKENKRKPIDTL